MDALAEAKLSQARRDLGSEAGETRLAGLQRLQELPTDAVANVLGETVCSLAVRDTDREIREAAKARLQGFGPEFAERMAAFLAESLSDENRHHRGWACDALALMGPGAGAHAEALAELLTDKASFVRRAAAAAIGELGGEPHWAHVELLVAALKDYESEVRRGAVRGLGAMGPAAAEHASKVVELVHDPSYTVRREAATALAAFGEEAKQHSIWLLTLILRDDNAEVRASAAAALKKLGHTDGGLHVRELANALREEDPKFRLRAAEALAIQGSVAGPNAKQVAGSLQDAEAEVRQVAASVFEAMDHKTAAAFAAQLADTILQDENMDVQQAASRALAVIPGDAGAAHEERFAQALKDELRRVRLGGALGLRALRGAAAPRAGELALCLMDESWFVRRAAAEAIGLLGPAAAPFTEKLLSLALGDSDSDVRRAAVEAFAAQGVAAAQHVDKIAVLATPEETKVPVRCAAGLALGVFGEASRPHLQKLRDMLRAQRSELRRSAAEAYGGLRGVVDQQDVEILEQCMRRDHAEDVKLAARHSLLALGVEVDIVPS